jgi:hypothetical protein
LLLTLRRLEFSLAVKTLSALAARLLFLGVPMELKRCEKPKEVSYVGKGTHALLATEEIKLDVNGHEHLKVCVPNGKVWQVDVTVRIRETNA